jgi:chain length determinant protein EpsF
MSLPQYFSVLKARRITILAILTVSVVLVMAVSVVLPTIYTATATVLLDVKSTDPIGGAALATVLMPETLQAYMATQAAVISSERTAQKVIKKLQLDKSEVLRDKWAARSADRPSFDAWLVELLRKRLDVRPSRDRNVIDITYADSDRQLAAQVANAFAHAYLETDLELKVEPARNFAAFFDERTKAVRDKLEKAQTRVSEFQRTKGILVSEERLDVENTRLAELSSQLTAIQAATVEAASKQKQTDGVSEAIPSPLVQSFRADLAKAEAKLRELGSQYGTNHPLYQRTEAEVRTLRETVGTETTRTTRVTRQREANIRAAYEAQKQRVLVMKEARDQAYLLIRDVENANKEYEVLLTRLGQSRLESQANQTNVTILNPATEPSYPSSPKLFLNLVLAVFIGLVAGVGTAFGMEAHDRRIRNADDLAETLRLPVLAVLGRAAAARLVSGGQLLPAPGPGPTASSQEN